jgi:hypothetical protein
LACERLRDVDLPVIIDADLNGDSTADMQILVAGTSFMNGIDFIV